VLEVIIMGWFNRFLFWPYTAEDAKKEFKVSKILARVKIMSVVLLVLAFIVNFFNKEIAKIIFFGGIIAVLIALGVVGFLLISGKK